MPLVILNFFDEKKPKILMCGCWFVAILWLSPSSEHPHNQLTHLLTTYNQCLSSRQAKAEGRGSKGGACCNWLRNQLSNWYT